MPDAFTGAWLKDRPLTTIERALVGIAGHSVKVQFVLRQQFAEEVDWQDVLGILKDYMASGLFSRGGVEMPSECSLLMVGNTDYGTREAEEGEEVEELLSDDAVPGMGTPPVDEERGTVGERYLFRSLPVALHDTALFDRLHGFVPGWRVPKLEAHSFSGGPGFISDYSEILHRLRRDDHTAELRARLRFSAEGGALNA